MHKITFSKSEVELIRASSCNDEGDALEWDDVLIKTVIEASHLSQKEAEQALESLKEKEILNLEKLEQGVFHFSPAGLEYALHATGFQSEESLEQMLKWQIGEAP